MQTSQQHSLCHLHTSTLAGHTCIFRLRTLAPPPGAHTWTLAHPFSAQSVRQSQSLYNTHQMNTCVCALPDLTAAQTCLQSPSPCTPAATPRAFEWFYPKGKLPPNCTLTLDPFLHLPQILLGASRNASLTLHSLRATPRGSSSPIFPPFSPHQSSETENELWAGQLCQGPALVHLTH